MQNFIGNRVIGTVKREMALQLGQILSKKVGSIDYDFPGAAYYCRPRSNSAGAGNEIGIIPKYSIYYRQTASPYKYAPLAIGKIKSLGGSASYSDFRLEHSDAYALGYDGTGYITLWDESASKWSDMGSDSITFTNKTRIQTTKGLANAAVSDMLAFGAGVKNMQDWVLLDEEVNLRSDANPAAVSADVIASFIYDGRINADAIAQWRAMPTNLKKKFREDCGRLFADTL